ncbi:hypothetical protein CCAX7_26020 [Capsulimonas corticalis]|uniref:Uncharacterized protein n=1 Tax=Capsulimonas corticalis TaxID=2219043 RepID=A0A402CVW1_9BACT|nr:hypothetical protein CCAX7_26020 [Capsulimonas corticalis]
MADSGGMWGAVVLQLDEEIGAENRLELSRNFKRVVVAMIANERTDFSLSTSCETDHPFGVKTKLIPRQSWREATADGVRGGQ